MFLNIFQHKPIFSINKKNKSNTSRFFTKALIVSTSLGLYASSTQAADLSCIWSGRMLEAGKWSDSTDWSTCKDTFPNNTGTNTFDATLRTGIAGVDLDKNIEIQTFNFNGGTLNGANDLTINEFFNWTRGNLLGTGIIDAHGGLELGNGRKVIANEQLLINSQIANWAGGTIDLFGTSQLINDSGATFNVTGDSLRMFGSSTAQFINEEDGSIVINLSGPSLNVQFDGPPFNNNGTVLVEQGIARLGGGGTSAGAFEVADEQLLNFSGGSHRLLPTSSVAGSNVEFSHADSGGSTTIEGAYQVVNTVISGNTAIFNAAISFTESLTQTGGFLNGTADIIVTGKTTLSGGVIESLRPDTEPQALLAAVDGLDINGNFLQIVGNRRILNVGVANWTSGGIRLNNTLTRFENGASAIFNIKEDASFIVGAGRNIGADPTVPLEKGLFVNRGDVVVDLGDDREPVLINTGFANLGRVHLQADNLVFGDFLIQFDTGALLFDIGGPNPGELDVLTVAGNATLDGIIDITLTNSFVPEIGATFDILVATTITAFQTAEGFSIGGQDGSKFNAAIVILESGNQVLRLTYQP